jgi:hypothetical protein
MKTVAILQPAYLPWLGYFERIALADELIVLDHVRIDRNSKTKFANRNRVRTAQGSSWLTVPLRTKGRADELALNALEIDEDSRWRAKHWATIEQNYRRAPFFSDYAPALEQAYATHWSHLAPLCERLTADALAAFGIRTALRKSSAMNSRSQKSALILDLCLESGATHYLSGPFGRHYLDLAAFSRAGLSVRFHDYAHPSYAQSYPGFVPNLCAWDLLFHAGPSALSILHTASEARAA